MRGAHILAESNDPYSSSPSSPPQGVLTMNSRYFFFFFDADFFPCACAACFVAFFPGLFEVFTSSPPSCAGFAFFSFLGSSGALNDCPSKAISVMRTAV